MLSRTISNTAQTLWDAPHATCTSMKVKMLWRTSWFKFKEMLTAATRVLKLPFVKEWLVCGLRNCCNQCCECPSWKVQAWDSYWQCPRFFGETCLSGGVVQCRAARFIARQPSYEEIHTKFWQFHDHLGLSGEVEQSWMMSGRLTYCRTLPDRPFEFQCTDFATLSPGAGPSWSLSMCWSYLSCLWFYRCSDFEYCWCQWYHL
jgi:hypothetical protein